MQLSRRALGTSHIEHRWSDQQRADLLIAWLHSSPPESQKAAALRRLQTQGYEMVGGELTLVMGVLLAHGVQPVLTGNFPNFILDPYDPDQSEWVHDAGWTLLHVAAWFSTTSIVRLFLDHGMAPDAQSKGGLTPLHAVLLSPSVDDPLYMSADDEAFDDEKPPGAHLQMAPARPLVANSVKIGRWLLQAGGETLIDHAAPVIHHRTARDVAHGRGVPEVWQAIHGAWERARLKSAVNEAMPALRTARSTRSRL